MKIVSIIGIFLALQNIWGTDDQMLAYNPAAIFGQPYIINYINDIIATDDSDLQIRSAFSQVNKLIYKTVMPYNQKWALNNAERIEDKLYKEFNYFNILYNLVPAADVLSFQTIKNQLNPLTQLLLEWKNKEFPWLSYYLIPNKGKDKNCFAILDKPFYTFPISNSDLKSYKENKHFIQEGQKIVKIIKQFKPKKTFENFIFLQNQQAKDFFDVLSLRPKICYYFYKPLPHWHFPYLEEKAKNLEMNSGFFKILKQCKEITEKIQFNFTQMINIWETHFQEEVKLIHTWKEGKNFYKKIKRIYEEASVPNLIVYQENYFLLKSIIEKLLKDKNDTLNNLAKKISSDRTKLKKIDKKLEEYSTSVKALKKEMQEKKINQELLNKIEEEISFDKIEEYRKKIAQILKEIPTTPPLNRRIANGKYYRGQVAFLDQQGNAIWQRMQTIFEESDEKTLLPKIFIPFDRLRKDSDALIIGSKPIFDGEAIIKKQRI